MYNMYIQDYTHEEILEQIELIYQGKEEELTIPLRIIKKEFPREFKRAYKKSSEKRVTFPAENC